MKRSKSFVIAAFVASFLAAGADIDPINRDRPIHEWARPESSIREIAHEKKARTDAEAKDTLEARPVDLCPDGVKREGDNTC